MFQPDADVTPEAKLADRSLYPVLKRGMDLVLSAILLLILSPLLLILFALIALDSPGHPIFAQERVGRDLQPFRCLKFRSMHVNAEAMLARWRTENSEIYEQYRASNFKLKNDPRVTRMGAFVRRHSLDELPQLLNVLLGDMSLIGPRPLLMRELTDYSGDLSAYGSVRPGITGLWQVSGRSNTTFADRARLDGEYVKTMSLAGDLSILLRTVSVVFGKNGAY
jgi:lipopolysaccharide/colanic/teichoic acid biosynthesis glycosyltransferase